MFYTTYKTTNSVNGHFYFGKHAANNPYDSYLGSGTRLKTAIKKYGKQNFSKEVLGIHATEEDMNAAEAALITSEMLSSDECYNIIPGGAGGRPSEAEGKRRTFISKDGCILEGRLCAIAWNTRIPEKKLQDVLAGRRKHYRGLRLLSAQPLV